MQQGSSATGTAGASTATGSGLYLQPGQNLTDEQILGLEPGPAADSSGVAQGAPTGSVGGPEDFLGASQHETASGPPANAGAPRATAASSDATEPEWLKSLDAQPDAAAEARRWRQAAQDAAALDADYFSADAGARAGLAARLHESDPAAFRGMLVDAARLLAERDPQGLADLARQLGATSPAAPNPTAARSVAQAARSARAPSVADVILSEPTNLSDGRHAETQRDSSGLDNGPQNDSVALGDSPRGASAFPAEAYRAFESATNDDVARQVRDSIDRALTATLPDGIASGARRRIGDDIFRDLNATLSADRELAAQINGLLRGWRFDASTRQQVAGLLAGRARTALPEVARRVVSEWTSSVLASDRAKNARIESAAARRDITGGRLPEPVASSVRLGARPVDYARTSDEQIMEM